MAIEDKLADLTVAKTNISEAISFALQTNPKRLVDTAGRMIASGMKNVLFGANEQGVWYDPSDFERYMSALGPELVTNGDFSNGLTEWSGANGGVLSVSNGEITVTNGVTGVGRAAQMIPTEIGKTYRLTAVARVGSASSAQIGWGTVLGSIAGGHVPTTSTVATTLSMTFVATASTTGIALGNASTTVGNTSIFDNISVRELTAIDTATLYQDAAGTIPVTAVEQPVGLMLDKSKGLVLGPELVPNGDFSQGATGWTVINADATHIVTFADGGMRFQSDTATPALQVVASVGTLPAGKTYQVEAVCSKWASGSVKLFETANGTLVVNGVGKFTARITPPGGTQVVILRSSANVDLTLDSISVRELPGNHAMQTTATSRPVLSARVNLLTETEFRNGVTDAPTRGGLVSAASLPGYLGAIAIGYDGATSSYAYKSNYTVPANIPHKLSVVVKMDDGNAPVLPSADIPSTNPDRDFVLVIGSTIVPSVKTESLGGGYYRISGVLSLSTAGPNCGVVKYRLNSPRTFKVTAYDLRPTNTGTNLPDYQRVNTATDYDTAGFPYYLKFDGTDDWLVTSSINFTGTDKVSLFAGLRKLSDAAAGTVAELSANSGSTPNTFALFAPGAVAPTYAFRSSGTMDSVATATTFASPVTNVLTGLGDIAGDSTILRANGVLAASSTVDQGPGNFGNYPLYIGRRAGTSLSFNGHLYGLIIRGASTTQSHIECVETYMNSLSQAY